MSPTAARKIAAQMTLTPGTVISRLTCRDLSASWQMSRSTCSISESRNSMWRRPACTVSASSSGSSSPRSQLRPLTPNRSDTGGRPFRRRINTAWSSFLTRERALTSCPRRDSRRRMREIHSGGTHTASSSPVHNSLASVRASSRSVFARACEMPVSPGGDHDDLAHMRLQQPDNLPRATRHLQRHPIGRQQTLRQRLDPLRSRRHPAGRVHLALLADRDLDEVEMHIQADAPAQRP